MFGEVQELFRKYKEFAFNLIMRVPYGSVPAWIKFGDGRVEEAFEKERGIKRNIVDTYVITVLNCLLYLIEMWLYIPLLILYVAMVGFLGMLTGGLLLSTGGTAGLMAVLPGVAVAVIVVALVILLLPCQWLCWTASASLILMILLILSYAVLIGYFIFLVRGLYWEDKRVIKWEKSRFGLQNIWRLLIR